MVDEDGDSDGDGRIFPGHAGPIPNHPGTTYPVRVSDRDRREGDTGDLTPDIWEYIYTY